MGFDFDRIADGRALKCLTVVDDATQESEMSGFLTLSPRTKAIEKYSTQIYNDFLFLECYLLI